MMTPKTNHSEGQTERWIIRFLDWTIWTASTQTNSIHNHKKITVEWMLVTQVLVIIMIHGKLMIMVLIRFITFTSFLSKKCAISVCIYEIL